LGLRAAWEVDDVPFLWCGLVIRLLGPTSKDIAGCGSVSILARPLCSLSCSPMDKRTLPRAFHRVHCPPARLATRSLPSPPPLPPLDRSAQPVQPTAQTQPMQLTGPQKFDSLDAKLAVQKAMVSDVKLIKFTTLFPCAVAACLNMTNAAQVSFDLTFMQYRFSPMCAECMKRPRP
jgi:hypothetical protein